MRVILETPPVPTTFKDFRSGQSHQGKTSIRVTLWDAGDVTPDQRPLRTVAELRQNSTGGVTRLSPSVQFVGAEDAVIPLQVLSALPDDARIGISWVFSASGT